jgi:FMN phosphatase YigB (HAD superfamily)
MVKAFMFDLWDTLVQGEAVLPHAREALDVLSKFEDEAGDKLASHLVADYDVPARPRRKLDPVPPDFIKLLDDLDLKRFFEPVERRVVLLTRGGSPEARRQTFERAVRQLGLPAGLDECLFISGDARRLDACRKMGMRVLRFGPADSPGADFNDWAEAPLLLAPVVAPGSSFNMKLALQLYLAAARRLELVSIDYAATPDTIEGRVKKSFPVTIQTRDGGTETIHTRLPVNVVVKLNRKGKVKSVKTGEPTGEELAESAHFVKTLEDNQQLSRGRGELMGRETHALETDEKGEKHLKHKRSTAV